MVFVNEDLLARPVQLRLAKEGPKEDPTGGGKDDNKKEGKKEDNNKDKKDNKNKDKKDEHKN
eukprot:6304662-Pyramimonas_sp.AAC.1